MPLGTIVFGVMLLLVLAILAIGGLEKAARKWHRSGRVATATRQTRVTLPGKPLPAPPRIDRVRVYRPLSRTDLRDGLDIIRRLLITALSSVDERRRLRRHRLRGQQRRRTSLHARRRVLSTRQIAQVPSVVRPLPDANGRTDGRAADAENEQLDRTEGVVSGPSVPRETYRAAVVLLLAELRGRKMSRDEAAALLRSRGVSFSNELWKEAAPVTATTPQPPPPPSEPVIRHNGRDLTAPPLTDPAEPAASHHVLT